MERLLMFTDDEIGVLFDESSRMFCIGIEDPVQTYINKEFDAAFFEALHTITPDYFSRYEWLSLCDFYNGSCEDVGMSDIHPGDELEEFLQCRILPSQTTPESEKAIQDFLKRIYGLSRLEMLAVKYRVKQFWATGNFE